MSRKVDLDHNFDKDKFSELLQRACKGRTQAEFALDCSISNSYLNRYINKKKDHPPIPSTLKKIAMNSYNNVKYSELLQAAGYEPNNYITEKDMPIFPNKLELDVPVENIIISYMKQSHEQNYNEFTNKLLAGLILNIYKSPEVKNIIKENRVEILKEIDEHDEPDERMIKAGEQAISLCNTMLKFIDYLDNEDVTFLNKILTYDIDYEEYLNQNFKEVTNPIKGATYPVAQFDLSGKYIRTYASVKEAAKILNCGASCIRKAIHGERKKAAGYIWKLNGIYISNDKKED